MPVVPQQQLTVAILVGEDQRWQRVERTAATLLESGRRAHTRVKVLVATSVNASPESVSIPVKTLFPLGRAYFKNRVLDAAEAQLVGFVDAGAEIPPGWVGAVVRSLADPSVAMVFAPVRGSGHKRSCGQDARHRRGLRQLIASARACSAPNLALARDAAIAIGGFDLRTGREPPDHSQEDLDIALRLAESGWRIACCGAMSYARSVRKPRPDARRSAARQIGAIARRRRSLQLSALYVASLPPTDLREGFRQLRAFAAGLSDPRPELSPARALEALPVAVRNVLADSPLTPLPASRPPKTHLMYAVGDALLLHVYVNPSAHLRRSLQERELIRSSAAVQGIPVLHVVAEGTDAFFVVEDRLRGAHPARDDAAEWFDRVAEWAIQFSGEPGPPLGESPEWPAHGEAVLAVSPRALQPRMEQALQFVGRLPAAHMHGDFQRRNLLLTDSSIGLVDWEGSWLRGIPGIDLLFLAVLARSDTPDRAILENLVGGEDPPFGVLSSHLSRVGVTRSTLPPVLLATLGTWMLGEERRVVNLGAPASSPRPYRELLLALAPRLAC